MPHTLPIPCALVFERLLRRGACLTLVDEGNAPLIVYLHMTLTQQALQQAGARAQAFGASQPVMRFLHACCTMVGCGGQWWHANEKLGSKLLLSLGTGAVLALPWRNTPATGPSLHRRSRQTAHTPGAGCPSRCARPASRSCTFGITCAWEGGQREERGFTGGKVGLKALQARYWKCVDCMLAFCDSAALHCQLPF